jgi:hypothetical protein
MTISADRQPKRSKINIVAPQVVTHLTKKSKTATCSRRLPLKIRLLLYKNQAYYYYYYYCYDVVLLAAIQI